MKTGFTIDKLYDFKFQNLDINNIRTSKIVHWKMLPLWPLKTRRKANFVIKKIFINEEIVSWWEKKNKNIEL